MIYLVIGIFLLLVAAACVFLAFRGGEQKSPAAPTRPASNEVVFFSRIVNVMIGGKSFGSMTQMSLPGDTPEVWQIELAAPNTTPSDRRIVRQYIGTRAEAEEWVRENVQLLASTYEQQFVHESSTVGA